MTLQMNGFTSFFVTELFFINRKYIDSFKKENLVLKDEIVLF